VRRQAGWPAETHAAGLGAGAAFTGTGEDQFSLELGQAVRAFAKKYTREADLRIADEQRRAETRKALREFEYDDPEGDGSDGDGGPPQPDDPEGSC
jgi:hypothetical protein